MFLIPNNTISVRFTDSEKEVVNDKIQAFQEKQNVVFGSGKELFTAMLNDCIQPLKVEYQEVEKELPPNTVVFTDQTIELLNRYAVENNIITNVIEEIVLNLLQTPPQKIEIEKEVVKERELNANEALLSFTENEMLVIEQIRLNRKRKFNFPEIESLPVLAKKLAFNGNTILDLGGEFYTGIPAYKSIPKS